MDVSLSASYGIMFGDHASKAYAAHQVVYAMGTALTKFIGGTIESEFWYARLYGQVYAENQWEIPYSNGVVMSWESICEEEGQSRPIERWYKETHGERFTKFVCETPYNQYEKVYDTSADPGNDKRTRFAIGKCVHAVIHASRAPNYARRNDGDVDFTPQLAKVLKKESPLNLCSLMLLTFCVCISAVFVSYIPPIITARLGRSPTYRHRKR